LGLGGWSLTPSWVRDEAPNEPPTSGPGTPDLPTRAGIPDAPAADATPAHLPPPGNAAAPVGEFDRPPAPPSFGTQPVQRPVIDPTARPLPPRKPEAPATAGLAPSVGAAAPGLPTRGTPGPTGAPAPGHAASALAGPDRLGGATPDLPTRLPGRAFTSDADGDTPTQASKLDADAIRERLRAFQQEYRLGRSNDAVGNGHGAADHTNQQPGVE
jgi:hypothetical protein